MKHKLTYPFRKTLLIISIALIGMLFSCMPQSKYSYTAEDMEVPEEFRVFDSIAKAQVADSSNIADLDWRSFFKDETLIELITEGLEHNFDMQQALRTIDIAQEYAKQSRLEWLPSLNADVAAANYEFYSEKSYASPSDKFYGNNSAPDNMFIRKAQNYTGLNLSWEIDIWGKIRSQRAAAEYAFSENESEKRAIQSRIVANIAEAYYNLLLLRAQLDVAQSNFELSENTYRIVKLQYSSANVTALAKQQTKSQMLTYKAMIPQIKQKIAMQENELSFLIGKTPNEIPIGESDLWTIKMDTSLSYGVPLQLIDNRPDIQSKEFQLFRKNAEVGVAQTKRYPSLQIDVGTGVNSMMMRNWFNVPGAIFGNLLGNLTQPIFNKGRLKADFEVAKLEREKAELDFQKTAFNAVREVSNALIAIDAVEEQLDIAEEQVETTDLAVSQSSMLFNSGYATYLEVITAQENALKSELNLNEIRHSMLVARVQLYRALGGGWH